jgi:hypothetical protein
MVARAQEAPGPRGRCTLSYFAASLPPPPPPPPLHQPTNHHEYGNHMVGGPLAPAAILQNMHPTLLSDYCCKKNFLYLYLFCGDVTSCVPVRFELHPVFSWATGGLLVLALICQSLFLWDTICVPIYRRGVPLRLDFLFQILKHTGTVSVPTISVSFVTFCNTVKGTR